MPQAVIFVSPLPNPETPPAMPPTAFLSEVILVSLKAPAFPFTVLLFVNMAQIQWNLR